MDLRSSHLLTTYRLSSNRNIIYFVFQLLYSLCWHFLKVVYQWWVHIEPLHFLIFHFDLFDDFTSSPASDHEVQVKNKEANEWQSDDPNNDRADNNNYEWIDFGASFGSKVYNYVDN